MRIGGHPPATSSPTSLDCSVPSEKRKRLLGTEKRKEQCGQPERKEEKEKSGKAAREEKES